LIGVLDMGPRVLAYSINGKIEKPDIERVVADMDAKVPTAEKVRLYVEVNEPNGMTPEALFRDLQLGVPRTQYLLRIERVAIVTDSNPVRTFANAQAKVARWFETRVFENSQKAEAAAWIQS
jgi:hypothetical protein